MTNAAVSRTRNQHQQEPGCGGEHGHGSVGRPSARSEREKTEQDKEAQPDGQLQSDHRWEVVFRAAVDVRVSKRVEWNDAAFQTRPDCVRETPDVCPGT